MKYAMLIFHEESDGKRTPADLGPWIEFSRKASAFGTELAGAPLEASRTAQVVSERAGKPLVTDGPFVETKEQLCGYYLFDCPDRESALRVAALIPVAAIGHIEVRPVVDFGAAAG